MSVGATAPDECSYSARHLHTHFLDGDVARAILVESREYLAQRRLFRPAFACGAHRLGARRDELVNGKRPVFVGTMGEFFIEVVVLQGNMRVGGVTRAKDCTSALLMSDMRVQRRRNARQHNSLATPTREALGTAVERTCSFVMPINLFIARRSAQHWSVMATRFPSAARGSGDSTSMASNCALVAHTPITAPRLSARRESRHNFILRKLEKKLDINN